MSLSLPVLTSDLTRFTTSLRRIFSRCRPWDKLTDTSTFSRPSSFSETTYRIRKNVSYFRINYLTVLASVLAISLLYHPLSLLTLVSLLAAWLFYLLRNVDQPLALFNRSVSEKEAMWILIGVTVVVILLTNIVWLILMAIGIGMGVVCVHGAMRDPEDLFMDEHEEFGASSGFLSFIGGGAASFAAVAASPGLFSPV